MVQARELPTQMEVYPKPKAVEARHANQRNAAEALLASSNLKPETEAADKFAMAEEAMKAYRWE